MPESDALAAKNRTVKGWDGQVSLCDLGYCTAGVDEGYAYPSLFGGKSRYLILCYAMSGGKAVAKV